MQTTLTLFVIDDEESIRETFKWHFEAQRYEVVAFESPLPMLKNCEPCRIKTDPCCDALIVDYNMPSMTGLNFLEQLPDYCKLKSSRIFLMSGALSDQICSRAKVLGVATVQKPFSLKSLSHIIDKVAGGRATPLTVRPKGLDL